MHVGGPGRRDAGRDSYQDSRKDKDNASEDLLVPNPNHATDDASQSGEGDEE